MTLHDAVEIGIISEGTVLPMYDDPDVSEMDINSTFQHYVEAVRGATFSIRVALMPTFQKGPCDAVRVAINFDGAPVFFYQDILKQGAHPLVREAHFTSLSVQNPLTGHWTSGKPTFARLHTKETNDSTGVKAERVQALGRIEIKVTRIKLLGTLDALSSLGINRVSELPEKMLKGKAIENTIDLANTIRIATPRPPERTKPIEGPLSKPLVFSIMYRSRRSLQSLGCIPRSPSPEQPTNTANPKEEIQQLRARLALLERSTNSKSEPRIAGGFIKREREEVDTQRSRKKSRSTGSIEVVDLTED